MHQPGGEIPHITRVQFFDGFRSLVELAQRPLRQCVVQMREAQAGDLISAARQERRAPSTSVRAA